MICILPNDSLTITALTSLEPLFLSVQDIGPFAKNIYSDGSWRRQGLFSTAM